MTVSLRAARESDIEALVVLDSRAFADPDRPDNDETHSFMADWFRAMIGKV